MIVQMKIHFLINLIFPIDSSLWARYKEKTTKPIKVVFQGKLHQNVLLKL